MDRNLWKYSHTPQPVHFIYAVIVPTWKFVYIITRDSFFSFAFFSAIGYNLFKGMIRDRIYLKDAGNGSQFSDVLLYNVSDLHFSSSMMREILVYISKKDKIEEKEILLASRKRKRETLWMRQQII